MDPSPSVPANTRNNVRAFTYVLCFLLVILLGLADHRLTDVGPASAPTSALTLVALDDVEPPSSRKPLVPHFDFGSDSDSDSDAASQRPRGADTKPLDESVGPAGGAKRNTGTNKGSSEADWNGTASLNSNSMNPTKAAPRQGSPKPPSASCLVLKSLYPKYDLSHIDYLAGLDLDVLRPARGRWVRHNDDAKLTLRRDITANRRCPLAGLYPSCSRKRTEEMLRYEWVEGEGAGNGSVSTRPKAAPRGQSLAHRLGRLRGKSVLLAGDSLTKQQFVSLSCMYFEAGYGINVIKEGPDDLHVSVPELHLHLRFVFAAYLMNASVVRSDKTKSAIDLGRLDDRIVRIVRDHHPDVLLFNTGAWSGVATFGPNLTLWTQRYLALVSAFHSQLQGLLRSEYGGQSTEGTRERRPFVVWRTTTQSHFERGDWNTDGSCGRAAPCVAPRVRSRSRSWNRSRGLDPVDVPTMTAAWLGLFSPKADSELQNALAERALLEATRPRSRDESDERTRLMLRGRDVGPFPVWVLDAQAMSRERCDAHVGEHHKKDVTVKDCIHWCLPGVVDTWNVALLDRLAP